MKIFLSHSSRIKPLVREVRSHLPDHVNSWIDEKDLIAGELLERSIRNSIEASADFLVCFIDESAVRSEWVAKELAWAKDEEGRLGRPFILPVLVEDVDLGSLGWLADRLFLRCHGYREFDVSRLADELSSTLFSWLSRDLDNLRQPPVTQNDLEVLDKADSLLQDAARHIRAIVLPYRKRSPLKLSKLYAELSSDGTVRVRSENELNDLLFRLGQRRLLSGTVISNGGIYVEEEHLNWRSQQALVAKQAIADTVSAWFEDESIIFLDAGSTTMLVCKNICRGVRFGEWERLTIVTNSVPLAAEFANVANDLGFEDRSPKLQIFMVGGRMRMNTSCVVALGGNGSEISALANHLGGFDLALVGTNGVYWPEGCTTTSPLEAAGKRSALDNAKRRVVLAESTKYNLRQDEVFAEFDMNLEIVTAIDQERSMVDEFSTKLEGTSSKILLVN